jgi:hypothetical protein
MGVATQNIAINDKGYVTTFGVVKGVNTSAIGFIGQILWYDANTSNSAGRVTTQVPTAPNAKIQIGVITKNGTTDGEVLVRVGSPTSLAFDSSVQLSSPATGEVLGYNGTSGRWENVEVSSLGINVALTNVQNGQVFVYDNGIWRNNNLTVYGSVNSVGLNMPTGFTVANSPITDSGTLGVTYAEGYSLPATSTQDTWNSAYGWGNHQAVGYMVGLAADSVTDGNIAAWNGTTGKLLKDTGLAISTVATTSYVDNAVNNVSGGTELTLIDDETIFLLKNNITSSANSAAINNGYLYTAQGNFVFKRHLDNLISVGNTATYGGTITSIAINNGFIYAGGTTTNTVRKYYEDNLAFVDNTITYGGSIRVIAINNGFIYVGGTTTFDVKRYQEDNLAFVDNSASYGNNILVLAVKNNFVYAGGQPLTGTNRGVAQYHESNLVIVGNTVNYATSATINSIAINNGFIYVGSNSETDGVRRYREDNRAFVDNSGTGRVNTITINNDKLYIGTGISLLKLNESDLSEIANISTGGQVNTVVYNNGFVYTGGNLSIRTYKDGQPYFTVNGFKFYGVY